MTVIDQAAQRGCDLPVRWAALLHDLGKGTTPDADLPRHPGHEARSVKLVGEVCARLKVPSDCRDLARLVARYHGDIHRGAELAAATIVRILENTDALRRPVRFEQLLEACACDFHGRLGWQEIPYRAPALFRQALTAVRGVDAASIAAGCPDRTQIAARLHAARVAAVRQALPMAAM
jgi:tRNA nucleotidyltransferase (CCA-adding enzyme)